MLRRRFKKEAELQHKSRTNLGLQQFWKNKDPSFRFLQKETPTSNPGLQQHEGSSSGGGRCGVFPRNNQGLYCGDRRRCGERLLTRLKRSTRSPGGIPLGTRGQWDERWCFYAGSNSRCRPSAILAWGQPNTKFKNIIDGKKHVEGFVFFQCWSKQSSS